MSTQHNSFEALNCTSNSKLMKATLYSHCMVVSIIVISSRSDAIMQYITYIAANRYLHIHLPAQSSNMPIAKWVHAVVCLFIFDLVHELSQVVQVENLVFILSSRIPGKP